jgi:hypothetical protein
VSRVYPFFQAVLDAIRRGDIARGRSLLNHLHEPNETCLGLSKARPAGRGVGERQADDLFERLGQSKAAKSGLLEELSDCELFIERFGPDKVSDVTTNVIRSHLIEYTQSQCDLMGIDLDRDVASGPVWNSGKEKWENKYVKLPVLNDRKILLVPKASVRWNLAFSHAVYYNRFVLEFLQAEHLSQQTALVETLQNGNQRVTKEKLKGIHPISKSFLQDFTEDNPEVLKRYKNIIGTSSEITDRELEDTFDERVFAKALSDALPLIDRGGAHATKFHRFMTGAIEFLFYPDLIYPVKEREIDEGRKRIDIVYTNNSSAGFFFRRRMEAQARAAWIFVECKNYSGEMANPELDQLAGRFSPQRGKLGFLIGRNFDDRTRFVARCKDTAKADRGFIIPLVDDDIHQMLALIGENRRHLIDAILERKWHELIA